MASRRQNLLLPMASPSKEAALALRRFLATPAGQDIINSMRSEPPRAQLDPSVHVYAHACGVRDGWYKAIDHLEDIDVPQAAQRTTSDRLE